MLCAIADGNRATTIAAYRDDTVGAFMDHAARNPGHVLLSPIQHADGILDVPDTTVSHMAKVAQMIAKAIKATDLTAVLILLGAPPSRRLLMDERARG